MAEVTVADVDQAEAALRDAKNAFFADRDNDEAKKAYEEKADHLADVRRAWRLQESAAGRRTGFAGGDAAQLEGE